MILLLKIRFASSSFGPKGFRKILAHDRLEKPLERHFDFDGAAAAQRQAPGPVVGIQWDLAAEDAQPPASTHAAADDGTSTIIDDQPDEHSFRTKLLEDLVRASALGLTMDQARGSFEYL